MKLLKIRTGSRACNNLGFDIVKEISTQELPEPGNTTADRVYYARCLLGYSILTLAKKAVISEVTISKIVHGKPAKITSLKKLSIVLKQPVCFWGCFEDLPENILPQRIRKARLWLGLTKKEFGALVRVNEKTVRLWENNSCEISKESLIKLKHYLDNLKTH